VTFAGLLLGSDLGVNAFRWAAGPHLAAGHHGTCPSTDSSGVCCIARLDINLPVPETGREPVVP
jgi:hypothetical protein